MPFIGKGGGGGGSGVVLRLGRGPLGRETMWQQRSAACQAGRVASARGAREEWFWPKPWASGLFGLGRGHAASQVSPAPAYGAAVGRAQGGGRGEMQRMANS